MFNTRLNTSLLRIVSLPGGRRTPHARTRYDTMIQTPGAADDKPLVSAQVMAPQDETPEDEESVSLLERWV
ncbi:hypothetical protein DPMN_142970 [Dreissena polymorpha]|uniref:Uncharacterized protein n=1 Tax=Dreissena polymorpha TaxID=45954 RepID=A0A9D4GFB7_DREPO|nr:hypothetical protein DPMN_142970 [Dreissena polymorpha]